MEGKRALEDTALSHDSAASVESTSRNYSPRLPTPEASRSSDTTSSISSSSYTDNRRGPAVSDLLSFRPHVMNTTKPYSDVKVYDTRPDSEGRVAPQSPPYPTSEDLRPSQTILPPLRTIIAHAMNSPPETPRTGGTSLQPSPREPSLSSATFKPLAFYPNKKQRIEERAETQPQWQSINNSSRAPLPPFHASTVHSSTTRRLSDPSNKRQRRYSHHATCNNSHCYELPDKNTYFQFTGRPHSSGTTTTSIPQFEYTSRERPVSFERFPISPPSEISYGKLEAMPLRTATFQSDRPQIAHSYHLHPVASPEYDQDTLQRPMQAQYRRTSYEQARMDYQTKGRSYDEQMDYHESCHNNDSHDYFLPPHCNYAPGKSRKRSNLPKQSTEIMKTWFDKNISNPYPSEEQKATFSSLTGISMTQVSNWFINHRRRCPELREKRERVRTGGMLEN